jgi:phosphatidylinositol-3-phosphatase
MRAVRWIIDTAGSVTGSRFRMIVASSSSATALIIGSTLASGGDSGLASQLRQALAALGGPAASPPAATTPASTPSAPVSSGGGGGGAPTVTAPTIAPVPSTPAKSTPTTPTSPTPQAGRVKHVFVISLNSPGYDAAFGAQPQMPYLANTLRPQGELLPNYKLLTDTGLPNYVGMIGGQSPNAGVAQDCQTYDESCMYSSQTIGVADQLFSARDTWGAYMEDMGKPEPVAQGQTAPANPPQNCVHPDSGAADTTQHIRKADPATGYAGSGYAARHNPFVYFHSLIDLGSCDQHDFPLTQLDGALASGTPNFTFISPNLCDTGEPSECDTNVANPGPAQADAFLSQWVPKIMASPAYQQDGVLIVTFGEAIPAVNGAPVGTLLLSKFLTPGSTNGGAFNPDSIFKTVEDLFGLQHIAASTQAGTTTFAPDLLGSQKTQQTKKKKKK